MIGKHSQNLIEENRVEKQKTVAFAKHNPFFVEEEDRIVESDRSVASEMSEKQKTVANPKLNPFFIEEK